MTRSEIKNWLSEWIADAVGMGAEDIEEDRTLGSYRLSSSQVASLAEEIEEFFEEPLEAGIVIKRAKVGRIIRPGRSDRAAADPGRLQHDQIVRDE